MGYWTQRQAVANLGITSKDAGECYEVRDSEVKLLKCGGVGASGSGLH